MHSVCWILNSRVWPFFANEVRNSVQIMIGHPVVLSSFSSPVAKNHARGMLVWMWKACLDSFHYILRTRYWTLVVFCVRKMLNICAGLWQNNMYGIYVFFHVFKTLLLSMKYPLQSPVPRKLWPNELSWTWTTRTFCTSDLIKHSSADGLVARKLNRVCLCRSSVRTALLCHVVLCRRHTDTVHTYISMYV